MKKLLNEVHEIHQNGKGIIYHPEVLSDPDFLNRSIERLDDKIGNLSGMVEKASDPDTQTYLLQQFDEAHKKKRSFNDKAKILSQKTNQMKGKRLKLKESFNHVDTLYKLMLNASEKERISLRGHIHSQILSMVSIVRVMGCGNMGKSKSTVRGIRIHLKDGKSQLLITDWI